MEKKSSDLRDGEPIKVYVRTKKMPARMGSISEANASIVGVVRVTRSVLQYEDLLDQTQQAFLNNARRFASDTGVPLEVIDLSKESVWKRLRRSLLKGEGGLKVPSAILPQSAFLGSDIFWHSDRNLPVVAKQIRPEATRIKLSCPLDAEACVSKASPRKGL